MPTPHKLNDGTVRGWLVFWTLAFALLVRPPATHASELPNQRGGLYVAQRPVSMVSSTVEVRVLGLMVETTVTQRFRNDLSTPIEAVYIFPLPVDAIVTGAQLQVDGLVVKAELQRRAQARASYERAVAAGTAASLLEQERADVFTMAVTAIAPGAIVEVVVAWDSVAQRGLDGWQLLLPLVVAPKQTPGTATGRPTTGTGRVPDTNRAPDASRLTPLAAPGAGIATSITVTFGDDVQNLRSPSHDLVTAADRRQVRIVEPQSNRDVVLRWSQANAPRGWVEQDVDGGYAAVMVEGAGMPLVAVARSTPASVVPLKLAIIVDRSLRMQGARMALARIFIRAALLSLGTTVDKISWVDGRTPIRWSASGDAAQANDAWLQQEQARFDVVAALQALRASGANAALLVSDGLYANDGEILAAAQRAGVTLYTVAVGSAPAHGLMRQLAASTQGTARSLAASEDATDVARAFAFDCNAVAQRPTVNWGTLAVTQQVPATLPRLGVGQAMLITGRLGNASTATIQVAGFDVALNRRASNRASAGALSKHGQLARQWARGQLQTMDPLNASAVALAQRYGVVTAGTALVATSDVIVAPGGTTHSVAIPVDAPADQVRWREESLRVDAGVTATGQTTSPAGPPPAVVPAAPAPRGAGAASPDSDDAEGQTYKDADALSAARVQTVESSNVYFRGRYGWRRTLTVAIGASSRADVQASAAQIRFAGVVTGLVAGSYLWSNRWSLGGEMGLVLRVPNATVLARPLLTLGIVDRNGRTSLLVGLGYQAALAPVASGAVDARAFAASLILRFWLTDLDLKRWSIETRVNAAFNGNGFSNDISVGAALHW